MYVCTYVDMYFYLKGMKNECSLATGLLHLLKLRRRSRAYIFKLFSAMHIKMVQFRIDLVIIQ